MPPIDLIGNAGLERFTTGLAVEMVSDGVAVNLLSPNRVVPTAGALFHGLTTMDDPDAEPPGVMAETALTLCGGAPVKGLTGRVAYSRTC